MAKNLATAGEALRPRLRGIITTVVLVLISVMIVRDILVRRWSAPPAPNADTTQHSR